jgi:hypothetical protein
MTPGLLGLAMLVHRPSSDAELGDLRLYFEYSRLSFGHDGNPSIIRWVHDRSAMSQSESFRDVQVPYRDFNCEYPPLAIAAFMATGLFTAIYTHYVVVFRIEMSLCVLLLCLVLYKVLLECGRPWPHSACMAGAMFSIMVFLLGSMLTDRFDVFSSLLVGLSLLFCMRKQIFFAGIFVGLGIATKVWPAVLLPMMLIEPFKQREYPKVISTIAAAVITVSLVHLPWLILSPTHAFGYLSFLGSRGLQIESLPANAVMILAKVLHLPAESVYQWGSQDLVSPALDRWAAGMSTLLSAVLYGLTLFLVYFSRTGEADRSQRLILDYVAVILAVLLTAKVFSPQYLVWLCPAILAVDLKRRWELFGFFVGACLCTKLELTFYNALNALQMKAIVMLTLRNVALCLMALLCLRTIARSVVSNEGRNRTPDKIP